jgi:hypothetical protein
MGIIWQMREVFKLTTRHFSLVEYRNVQVHCVFLKVRSLHLIQPCLTELNCLFAISSRLNNFSWSSTKNLLKKTLAEGNLHDRMLLNSCFKFSPFLIVHLQGLNHTVLQCASNLPLKNVEH